MAESFMELLEELTSATVEDFIQTGEGLLSQLAGGTEDRMEAERLLRRIVVLEGNILLAPGVNKTLIESELQSAVNALGFLTVKVQLEAQAEARKFTERVFARLIDFGLKLIPAAI